MKTIGLVFFSLLLCFNSFGQAYEKLKETEVPSEKKEIAKKFIIDYFAAQKNGSYYQFKDEATEAIKKQLTESNQEAGYKMLKDNFGDFTSADYAETWIAKSNPTFKILRFKANFDKSPQKLEIRVILNDSNQIAGFWIKPWNDALN
jgi:hypothetical protein